MDKEQELLVLGSRVTFDCQNSEKFIQIANEKIDWFMVLNYCIMNKVVGLFWYNAEKYKIDKHVPSSVKYIYDIYKYSEVKRNKAIIDSAIEIQQLLQDNDVKVVPLKGLILSHEIYEGLSMRHMNDMDFLIKYDDIKKVQPILEQIGYQVAKIDSVNKKLIPYSREEQIAWSMYMNNHPPFSKVTDNPIIPLLILDFSFSLDFKRDFNVVNSMVENSKYNDAYEFNSLNSADFFIHLCCHIFKEATNAIWVLHYQDINLIKFCDAREYLLKNNSEEWRNEVISKSIKYDTVEAVYFTIYHIIELYNDNIEEYLQDLNIQNKDFLYSFGKREFGIETKWRKTFIERLFSLGNLDELDNLDMDKLIKLI